MDGVAGGGAVNAALSFYDHATGAAVTGTSRCCMQAPEGKGSVAKHTIDAHDALGTHQPIR
jgi:hypothetical protein